jgi:hypothetical protein
MSEAEWVFSPRFSESGDWIVHKRGGNRQPKIAYCSTRERAEQVANALNGVAEAVAAEREACLAIVKHYEGEHEPYATTDSRYFAARDIAAAIRARGETPVLPEEGI